MGTILICLTLLWAGEVDKVNPTQCSMANSQQAAWALSWCADNMVACSVKLDRGGKAGVPFLHFRVDTLMSIAPVLPISRKKGV